MSLGVNNNSEQAKVWINGQYKVATQTSNGDWFVEIDGKKVKVDKNDLFGVNNNLTEHPQYLVDYYDNLINKNNEKIDSLKAMGKFIQEQLDGAKKQYTSFLAKFGVDNYKKIDNASQQAVARKFYNDISDANRAKISNSNSLYSEYNTAFDYALDKGNCQNQLDLAQSVENSIFGNLG